MERLGTETGTETGKNTVNSRKQGVEHCTNIGRGTVSRNDFKLVSAESGDLGDVDDFQMGTGTEIDNGLVWSFGRRGEDEGVFAGMT